MSVRLLIVIDPVSAYFEGMDPNSNADVRLLLRRLADLKRRQARRWFS